MKNPNYIQDLLESPLFNEWAESGFNQTHNFTSTSLYLNASKESIKLAKTIKSSLRFKSSNSLDLKKRSSLLKTIHQNIEVTTAPVNLKPNKAVNYWKLGSIAATLLILVAVVFTISTNEPDYFATGLNENLTQELSDGSIVTLDANSSIQTIGKWKGINPRKVKLENSAFFNVTEGPLFSVETDLVTIDVLGTEFFVDTDNEEAVVTVRSGKVRVKPKGEPDSETQILEAGDRVVYKKSLGIVKSKVSELEISNELAWINGKIVFNKTNYKELKQLIEQRYGKTVNIHPSLLTSQRAIEGTFPTTSLTALLASIETAFDLQINYKGDVVNISYQEIK